VSLSCGWVEPPRNDDSSRPHAIGSSRDNVLNSIAGGENPSRINTQRAAIENDQIRTPAIATPGRVRYRTTSGQLR
jgi:hypothetical protein